MPPVRINIKRNPDASYAKRLGKIVYDSMKAAINVTDHDNFQVLAEHDNDRFVYDPTSLLPG